MSLILPKDEAKDFELPPADSHVAICYRIVDLGTQQTDFKGKITRNHKIMLSWEIAELKMEDGRPFSVHKRYTLPVSKYAFGNSNLKADLESWRGASFTDEDYGNFDIGVLIGKPCMLGIVHTVKGTNTYANISSIMRLPKGLTAPALVNETLYFSLNEFNQEIFNKFSESLQATIAKSPEYQELKGAHKHEAEVQDADYSQADTEIPF